MPINTNPAETPVKTAAKTVQPIPPGRESIPIRSPLANIAVIAISLSLLAWSVGFFKTRSRSVISVDAVVNANLMDLKSPEEGLIETVNVETGKAIDAKAILFQIRNSKVSDLKAQELTSKLNQYKSELAKAKASITQQEQLALLVDKDATNQIRLESSEATNEIQQVKADIIGAQSRHQLAQDNYRRISQLQSAGAIPEIQADLARSEMEQRASNVTSLEAKIATLEVNQAAIDQGLTLSRTRSNYDPAIRAQEIQLKTAQITQEIKGLEQQIIDTTAEITQAKRDSQMRQQGNVQAPISGIIWSVQAKPGQYVQRGDSLGKLADCSQRWVDAIVDDNILNEIQVGTTAKVQLRGLQSEVLLNGKVAMIRSGLGRLSAGEDVIAPVERNLPHQTQVRVALENVAQPAIATPAEPTGNLCHIGYTGRVSFEAKVAEADQSLWQKMTSMVQRLSS
jgi:multidrug resistance efflux pump